MKSTIEKAIDNLGKDICNSEIAFFGGSFTAIDRDYMLSLLKATEPYADRFMGIRISTRPDYIDDEVLNLLKNYKVTTIELGAQSMNDEVLSANNRGHSVDDVKNASRLIKQYGFNLGLQMMTGLYKATTEIDMQTAKQFVELNPDCVRIYPTVVMKNTELADLYLNSVYKTYTLEESVKLCSEIMLLFEENNINVIRVGLHYSDGLVENQLAGNYHPAFKELCETEIFYKHIKNKLGENKNIIIYVNPKSVSKSIGQNKTNIRRLNALGYNATIEKDETLGKYEVKVKDKGD